MATKLQWPFPAIYGNTPESKDYRPVVELREGEDFVVESGQVVLTRNKETGGGAGKVGVALFNDRWFADDYEFRDKDGHLLEVKPVGGGERNG